MRNFKDYVEFAFRSIEESIKIAKYSISTLKEENTDSCYGMAAIILLASSIDAIGTFYQSGSFKPILEKDIVSNNLGAVKDHFTAFYNKFLAPHYDCGDFMGSFYTFTRCRSVHNAVLGPRVHIKKCINKKGKFMVTRMYNGKKHSYIYLNELYKVVSDAYQIALKESSRKLLPEIFAPSTGGTIDNH